MSNGWIGVDFDGTLAHYDRWTSPKHTGAPVGPVVEMVKNWLNEGTEVRIFTARVFPLNRCILPSEKRTLHGTFLDNQREDDCWHAIDAIRQWCSIHLGIALPITNVKDFNVMCLYDDRCVQVLTNKGALVVN